MTWKYWPIFPDHFFIFPAGLSVSPDGQLSYKSYHISGIAETKTGFTFLGNP